MVPHQAGSDFTFQLSLTWFKFSFMFIFLQGPSQMDLEGGWEKLLALFAQFICRFVHHLCKENWYWNIVISNCGWTLARVECCRFKFLALVPRPSNVVFASILFLSVLIDVAHFYSINEGRLAFILYKLFFFNLLWWLSFQSIIIKISISSLLSSLCGCGASCIPLVYEMFCYKKAYLSYHDSCVKIIFFMWLCI